MMSLEAIRALNEKIAIEAENLSLEPYTPAGPDETDDYPPFPFPSLGKIPEGWEETESFFVDKTGVGRESEPALTIEQFRTLLHDHIADHPSHAYAITEEGPFQLVVSALVRSRAAIAKTLNR